MKKRFILILALCLCLSLCACGGDSSPTAPATDSTPATESAVETAPEGESPAIRGALVDDEYVNSYLNLRVALPEGWVFYNEEQLAQTNNLREELVKETDVAEVIAKSGQFTDMMMANAAGSSVNVLIQPSQAALSAYSDEQIFQLSEETFKTQMGSAGMEVKGYEVETRKVGGEDRSVLHISIEYAGSTLEEYQVWFRSASDYIGVVTAAVLDDTDPQTLLDGISTVS